MNVYRLTTHALLGEFIDYRHEFGLEWVIVASDGERFKILASQVYVASAPGDIESWLDAEIEREMLT